MPRLARPADRVIVMASDHNGVELKELARVFLRQHGYRCIDLGPYTSHEKVDYVDYAKTVGHIVDAGEARWGVLICGTGVGMSMVANRFTNVRASLVHSLEVARKSREHNDANVLCLGAWVSSPEQNLENLRVWLSEPFGEGRHVRRVEKTKEHGRQRVVLANGIFDVLHKGHIALLHFAKSLGGKLVVAINSDRATRVLKGPGRPVNNEKDRKLVLESLDCVDEVLVFDDMSSTALIEQLHPQVVVKGGEWTAEQVRARDRIPADIEVQVFPLVREDSGFKYSTTALLERAKARARV